jgi:hypothetical protein
MKIETNPRLPGVIASDNEPSEPAVGTGYKPDALAVPVAPTLAWSSEPNVTTQPLSARSSRSVHGSEAPQGEKPALEAPIAMRLIASRSAAPGAPTRQPEEDDLEVTPESLLGTRISAIKHLLGEDANDLDDTTLLGLANDIHEKADALLTVNGRRKTVEEALSNASPNDADAIKLSQELFAVEASVWLDWNGIDPSGAPQAKALEAYREVWDLAANPPSMPNFQSREQLAKARIEKENLKPQTVYPLEHTSELKPETTGTGRLETEKEHISRIADTTEVKQAYFNQFADYRNSNEFSRLLSFKALASTQSLGLLLRDTEAVTKSIFVIDRIGCFDGVTSRHAPRGDQLYVKNYRDNPAILALSASGSYVFIDSDGSCRVFDKSLIVKEDGRLSSNKILRAIVETDPKLSAQERTEWLKAIDRNHGEIEIKNESNSIKLRGLIERSNKKVLEDAFDKWKENNYNATGLYGLVRGMVPFFKTIEDSRNDPNFVPKFSEIAWDVFDVAITLGTVALSAGVGGAVIAGKNALVAGGRIGSVLTAGKAAVAQMKAAFRLKTFLKTAAKEAVDFVVPVFSAADLAKAGVRLTARGATAAGSGLAEGARMLLGRLASGGADLTHEVVSGAHKVKLSNAPLLNRYALPSLPDHTRTNDNGLWVSESGWDQYVKIDEDFYRVVEDRATSTKDHPIWKIQSPDGTANRSLDSVPIRVESQGGVWKVRKDGLGGLPGGSRDVPRIDASSVKAEFDSVGLNKETVVAANKCVADIENANLTKRLALDDDVNEVARLRGQLESACKKYDELRRQNKKDEAQTVRGTINEVAARFMTKLEEVGFKINKKLDVVEGIQDSVKSLVDGAISSGQSDGKIMRVMSEAEAKDIKTNGMLRQRVAQGRGNSFEQHKWFYTDPSHPPVQSKPLPFRLEVDAPKSAIAKIFENASAKPDDTLAPFRHKPGGTAGQPGLEQAEPGAFGVQMYGLEEFSRLLERFKWRIVNTADNKVVAHSTH